MSKTKILTIFAAAAVSVVVIALVFRNARAKALLTGSAS